jgi:hypothetical protein
MNKKKLIIKTPKEKIEALAKELEGNPDTQELAVVMYVVAGATLLGKEAQKSLALWNATWADSVINEVHKIKEEETVEGLTNNILEKDSNDE